MIANLHVPERLHGETQEAYEVRRRWSKHFARQTATNARIVTAMPDVHRVDVTRRAERLVTKEMGKRQARLIRKEGLMQEAISTAIPLLRTPQRRRRTPPPDIQVVPNA